MSPSAPAKASTASLFDVTEFTRRTVEGQIEMVPLDELELASNPRKEIDRTGIERLARMLASMGQLVPLIGQRVAEERVLIWDGQRRVLAARASHELAGTDGFEGLNEVRALIVVLLDHEPTADEIRRIQAQANTREDLTRRDQQEQFRDCWEARAGLPDEDRMVMVCEDLGISPQKGHHLRREIDLPDAIRGRVSEKPTGNAISVKMAGRLAAMHRTAPELTDAVAARITSRDLHDRAQQDMGAFVHRTVIEDETVYAVRIEDGAMLDAHKQLEDARRHLTGGQVHQLVAVLGCTKPDEVERKLDELATKARAKALKLRVDAHLRDRAANGNFAFRHDRGKDLAPSLWVIDPVFTIGLVAEQLTDADDRVAREETFFGGSDVTDDEVEGAAEAERARREGERRRQAEAAAMNTGLGHDIRAGLMDPTEDQLDALRALVCHLLVAHYPELIAYGAGWTDHANMRPVGDTARFEPRSIDAVVAHELRRALDDKDALRGIAQLAARLGAAFVLDPAGVTRTKALGAERMAKRIRDTLPGGEHPLRQAVWAFMRPMMSPHLVALNQDAFIVDEGVASSVDLAAHRGDSALNDLDLGHDDEDTPDAAA